MHIRRSVIAGVLLLASCNNPETAPGREGLEVFETFDHDAVYVDHEAPSERVLTTPIDEPVTALCQGWDQAPLVGTASGLYVLEDARAVLELPVIALSSDPSEDEVLVAHPNEATVFHSGRASDPTFYPAGSSTVTSALIRGSLAFVGTQDGLLHLGEGSFSLVPGSEGMAIRDLAMTKDRRLWLATDDGVVVFGLDDNSFTRLAAPKFLLDDDVRAVTETSDGEYILAATQEGLARIWTDTSSATFVRPEIGGLPNGDLLAVAERDGLVLTGHAIGATAMSASGKKDHYHSERWIPAERVTHVMIDQEQRMWLATPAGVSQIRFDTTTLTDKAAMFEKEIERHIRMDGFVTVGARLEDAHDFDGPVSLGDDDNDGQWTETQLGAWCFAYAATGDGAYYKKARRTFEVMRLQLEIPAKTFEAQGKKRGFITRSLVRDDEGEVFSSKESQPNWHKQDYEGRTYYWKDDTSADEYDGLFFGMPLYYDLCASDDAERSEVAQHLSQAMDYIIDNGYVVIDLDGERTSDGRWNDLAIALNGLDECVEKNGYEKIEPCIFSRHGGGWLNAVEILGYLLATWHVTGDSKYYDEYEYLHTTLRYGELVPIKEDTFTVTDPAFSNHSDHEMAILMYHTLLRYEPNEDRREIWLKSLLDFYEYERAERNPFQIGAIAGFNSADVGLAEGIRTLQEWPTDRRGWLYDNSHRLDFKKSRTPDRFGNAQFAEVPPYDEIRTSLWNASPYEIVGGGSGRQLFAPMPYLIAYWMMRYYGIIEPE